MAIDSSEAAQSAFLFVTEWARSFDAKVWFIQLAAESHDRHGCVVTDFARGGRRMANSFAISGATRGARTRQLVNTIADAATTYRADLLVVGFDRDRMSQGSMSGSLRDQLYEATNIPVLVAPRRKAARPVETRVPPPAIALGPGPAVAIPRARKKLAHV